jgi:hypothetical protein
MSAKRVHVTRDGHGVNSHVVYKQGRTGCYVSLCGSVSGLYKELRCHRVSIDSLFPACVHCDQELSRRLREPDFIQEVLFNDD